MNLHGAFLYFGFKCLKRINIRAIFFIEHTQNHPVFSAYFCLVKKKISIISNAHLFGN